MSHRDYMNQSQHTDPADAFDPYNTHQPHQTYDQGGYTGRYTDEPLHDGTTVVGTHERSDSHASGFEPDEFPRAPPETKNKRLIRNNQAFNTWGQEPKTNLWTRGGTLRCCGRFFCCTVMTVVFLVISVVLAFILWIRPPTISVGSISTTTSGGSSAFNVSSTGLTVNLSVNVTVDNPNPFSVDLHSLNVQLFYPINNTAIGGGQKGGVTIHSNQQTNFTLPFSLQYKVADDPSLQILSDLEKKCVNGQSLTVDYKITLGFQIIVNISPVISNSASFTCPLSASDIAGLISGSGLNLGG